MIEPVIHGGGHEKGLRSGSLATPYSVVLAKVVEIDIKEMPKEQERCTISFLHHLLAAIPDAQVNGSMEQRLAGKLNMVFPDVESEALMTALKSEIAVSSGSACATAAVLPSHVLKAIVLFDLQSHSSIRIGLGRFTTIGDVLTDTQLLPHEISRLRQFKEM